MLVAHRFAMRLEDLSKHRFGGRIVAPGCGDQCEIVHGRGRVRVPSPRVLRFNSRHCRRSDSAPERSPFSRRTDARSLKLTAVSVLLPVDLPPDGQGFTLKRLGALVESLIW